MPHWVRSALFHITNRKFFFPKNRLYVPSAPYLPYCAPCSIRSMSNGGTYPYFQKSTTIYIWVRSCRFLQNPTTFNFFSGFCRFRKVLQILQILLHFVDFADICILMQTCEDSEEFWRVPDFLVCSGTTTNFYEFIKLLQHSYAWHNILVHGTTFT